MSYATEQGYAVENGIIVSLGKFEREPEWTLYFWEMFLNGCSDDDDGETLRFDVTPEDIALFPELAGVASVYLCEDSSGFVSGSTETPEPPTVKLDNLDDREGCVMATVEGENVQEWARNDQSIAGSSWECASDMPDFAYAMPCDHPGLVAELQSEGYDLDLSEYCPPDPADGTDPATE